MNSKDQYAADAAQHGLCTESGDYKRGNVAVDRLMATAAKLRKGPDRGEAVLVRVLNHPSGWVRLWPATVLLPLRAELASTTLEDLASGTQSKLEFDAKMVLREWRAGRLKMP